MRIVKLSSSYQEPYPLQVVGEQSYREKIEEVTGYTGESEGINVDDFIAHLILDDNDIEDPDNAVVVKIDGKTVGYLSKGNAGKYRQRLKEIGLNGDVVGECYASIRGGFEKKDGSVADFGVRLDLIIDEMKLYITPPLKETRAQTGTMAPVPAAANAEVSKPIMFSWKKEFDKVKFLPMKGSGTAYYLIVFPFVGIINLYILLFAGIWLGIKWLVALIKK